MKIEPWYKDSIGGLAFCQAAQCMKNSYWQRYVELEGVRFRQRACDDHATGEGNEEFRQSKLPAHDRGASEEDCGCDDCCDAIFFRVSKAHYDAIAVRNAKPYHLTKDKDPCGRSFCRKCSGYHHSICEGLPRTIQDGGYCFAHHDYHKAGQHEVKR